ncbi:hypothetical protein AGABI1DRAFT_73784 [Agaricus bisporus var. burnettii JB137-S8]|uniref:Ribosome biogenesis protein ERB1 n=1 Tax=Agaricus bisporus var. burnettii (strain JB137-S8 / ATCC MYA-4627 / FGSC 10392) TaxID=597362 RepID=K5WYB3_AGABU|nr:uncharacterized protein AGABI1DRAFT_73784 [Agaricus bisporus var. burnettii JB137-S8]EKM80506.1 hypothetical protein AGABI1DRAFT_73784 [Agaricus bisporus var. burnettii JB137-S8]
MPPDGLKNSRKRKQVDEDTYTPQNTVQLEMLTDEEDTGPVSSDDDETEEFPEIDSGSDSESDQEGIEDDDEQQSDDDSDELDSDASLRIFPKAKTEISDITGKPKRVYPEIEADYDSDSSTEDAPNRVGNIPMHWYDDLPHIGYDINGKKVLRPARGDELDKFLATVDDPDAWMSAFDKNLQLDKPLTNEELDLIRRLYKGENPDIGYDPYEPMVEWFTGKGKEEIMPLSAAPEPKRRWIPSKWEKQKVMKIVRAIRQGRIVPNKPKSTNKMEFFSIWSDQPSALQQPPAPAPKVRLPTNSESYNPPEEYLPTTEEQEEWKQKDREDRERDYLPQKYPSLRLVPAYDRFIQERFHRQLDLYLAPRVQRVKLNMDPKSLIPKLPSPSTLRPFPNYKSLSFAHTKGRARCLSVSPDGAWVASGDEGGVVSLWEVNVGRETKRWQFKNKVSSIEWCPRMDVSYLMIGVEEELHFLIPPNLPDDIYSRTKSLLSPSTLPAQPSPSPLTWESISLDGQSIDKPILSIRLPSSSGTPTHIAWHRRGDYVATVSTGGPQNNVWIHQMSRRHSQAPFKKVKGSVQVVLFHPTKPHFFVATQQYIRIYNLSEQQLLKTLNPGMKWISSMDIHPSGDHLIVGGYDRKLCWFDLELSDKPYKSLRYHTRAIRSVCYHPTYPLFASSSDDGSIQVFHARVYNDLLTDALIVPLKILRGHQVQEGLGVLQIKWCTRQPWLLSSGADGQVALWCS